MENTELKYQGIIFDENPNDWVIGANTTLEIPINTNTKKFFYNQAQQKRTYQGCGFYSCAGVVSDLTGYEFSTEELLEIADLAEKSYGWSSKSGMYMSRAVDCVRDYWNTKFPTHKLFTTRTTIGSDIWKEALSKKHSLSIGYRTSKEYLKDCEDDGIVQGEEFPLGGGGHLIRMNQKKYLIIDDNYIGVKKFNTYINDNIEKLKRKGMFFPSAYLFLKYNDMGEYETQFRARYGTGTLLNDLESALEKCEYKEGSLERERFFLSYIISERAGDKK